MAGQLVGFGRVGVPNPAREPVATPAKFRPAILGAAVGRTNVSRPEQMLLQRHLTAVRTATVAAHFFYGNSEPLGPLFDLIQSLGIRIGQEMGAFYAFQSAGRRHLVVIHDYLLLSLASCGRH